MQGVYQGQSASLTATQYFSDNYEKNFLHMDFSSQFILPNTKLKLLTQNKPKASSEVRKLLNRNFIHDLIQIL